MEALFIIGRIIFGGYFIYTGLNHFFKFPMLTQFTKSKHIPFAAASVVITGAMLIAGGLGILFWHFVPIAALILAIFLIASGVLFHNFWKVTDPMDRMMQMQLFLRNMALVGALFLIAGLYYLG